MLKAKFTANFKRLKPGATIPVYSSKQAAACDLYAYIENSTAIHTNGNLIEDAVQIEPGETVKIGTGLAIQPPQGFCALIFARSGLASKEGLAPATKVSVIDCDYRGEIIVPLHNHSGERRVVRSGERVAQLFFTPYYQVEFMEGELSVTDRNDSGFGSSGK